MQNQMMNDINNLEQLITNLQGEKEDIIRCVSVILDPNASTESKQKAMSIIQPLINEQATKDELRNRFK